MSPLGQAVQPFHFLKVQDLIDAPNAIRDDDRLGIRFMISAPRLKPVPFRSLPGPDQ